MTQAGARVAQLNRAVGIRRAPGPAFDAWLDQYCSAPIYFVTISGKRPAAARGDGRSESGLRRSVWSICQNLACSPCARSAPGGSKIATRSPEKPKIRCRNTIRSQLQLRIPHHFPSITAMLHGINRSETTFYRANNNCREFSTREFDKINCAR